MATEKRPKFEPWQVIANQLQVCGPLEDGTVALGVLADIPTLQRWATACVKMLGAYGYKIEFDPNIAPK